MKALRQEITIPSEVTIVIEPPMIRVKGVQGEIERVLHLPQIDITQKDDKLILSAKKQNKTIKMYMNTYKAHILNMIHGVTEQYTYKLKICSGHFPMHVSIEHKQLVVKNFLGEKIPRKAKLLDDVEVKLDNDFINLKSKNKESVGIVASRIEQATRITGKDRRRFQDGIFIVEKAGKKIK